MSRLLPFAFAIAFGGEPMRSPAAAVDRPPTSAAEFLRAYKEDAARVRSIYRRMAGKWILSSHSERAVTVEFLGWDDSRRVVLTGNEAAVEGKRRLCAAFWKGLDTYDVYENLDGGRFIVPHKSGNSANPSKNTVFGFSKPVFALYHRGHLDGSDSTWMDLLSEKADSVTIRVAADGSSDFDVKVIAESGASTNDSSLTVTLTFAAHRCWVPKRIETVSRGAHPFYALHEIQYHGEFEGVPLVKRLRHYHPNIKSLSKSSLITDYEVLELRPMSEPPLESGFSPASIGAYEPGKEPRSFWWWIALLVAIGLVLITISYLRRSRRT